MNLPAERPAPPLTLTDCRISTGLWQRLASDAPADLEVEAIARVPALVAEVRALVPALSEVARPCGGEAVRRAMQPLVLVFGVGEAAKVAGFWKVYVEQLSAVPVEALTQAVDDYIGAPTSEFFPKPGPLKALAARRAEPILKALSRARRVAALPPSPTITREETQARKAEVERLMAGFRIKSRPPLAGVGMKAGPDHSVPPGCEPGSPPAGKNG